MGGIWRRSGTSLVEILRLPNAEDVGLCCLCLSCSPLTRVFTNPSGSSQTPNESESLPENRCAFY